MKAGISGVFSVLGSFGCETTKLNIDFTLLSDGQLGWFILDLMFEGAWLLKSFLFMQRWKFKGKPNCGNTFKSLLVSPMSASIPVAKSSDMTEQNYILPPQSLGSHEGPRCSYG